MGQTTFNTTFQIWIAYNSSKKRQMGKEGERKRKRENTDTFIFLPILIIYCKEFVLIVVICWVEAYLELLNRSPEINSLIIQSCLPLVSNNFVKQHLPSFGFFFKIAYHCHWMFLELYVDHMISIKGVSTQEILFFTSILFFFLQVLHMKKERTSTVQSEPLSWFFKLSLWVILR